MSAYNTLSDEHQRQGVRDYADEPWKTPIPTTLFFLLDAIKPLQKDLKN